MIKILHVDDNRDYVDLLATRLPLEDPECNVTKAYTVDDALDKIESKSFDCILADYDMPGMNGLELLREIRSREVNIPVIFLTGQGNEEIAAEALRSGADDYFTKDITFAQFLILVNSVKQNVHKYELKQREKETSQLLRRSEQYLSTLIESLEDMILVIDKDMNLLDYHAPGGRDAPPHAKLNLKPGTSIKGLFPPEFEVDLDNLLEQIAETGKTMETEYTTQMGENTEYYLVRVSPLQGEDNEHLGYLVVATDITDLKLNEEKLAESEAWYKFMLENAYDYVFCIDAETNKLIYISPKIANFMKTPMETILSTPNFALSRVHEDDKEMLLESLKERAKNPDVEHVVSFRQWDGEGNLKHIEQRSKLVVRDNQKKYVLGVFRDITKIMNYKRLLAQKDKDLQDIILHLDEAIVGIIDSKGEFKKVIGDYTLLKKLGIVPSYIIGKNIRDFYQKDYIEKNLGNLEKVFNEGQRMERNYTLVTTKARIPMRVTAIPILERGRIASAALLFNPVDTDVEEFTADTEIDIRTRNR